MKKAQINTRSIRAAAIIIFGMTILLAGKGKTQEHATDDVVSFIIVKPDQIKNGKSFYIDVQFNIEPGWYIYAPTGANAAQGMIETKVVYKLPRGIKKESRMKIPDPLFKNGYQVYEGTNVVMRQALQTSQSLEPGNYQITGKITWQSCNSEICLQPVTEEIITTIYIQ